jgi:hypothetical protein
MSEYNGRVFDRIPKWDPQNMRFLVAREEHPESVVLYSRRRTRHWTMRDILDQGREGACVGFGSAHYCQATPLPQPHSNDVLALKLYRRAKQIDEWPGEEYDGTSVLAGMKALKEERRISGYLWLQTTDEIAKMIGYVAPVIVGLEWRTGMMDTDGKGFVHADGRAVGGHCVCITGYDDKTKTFTFVNSWGEDWGEEGFAKISEHDLGLLLAASGEAVLPRKMRVRT